LNKNVVEESHAQYACSNQRASIVSTDILPHMFPTTQLFRSSVFLCAFLSLFALSVQQLARAQESKPIVTQEELENLTAPKPSPTEGPAKQTGLGGMNFLNLLLDGGALMIPIGLMSLLVVAVGVERAFALRSSKVFPRRLRREIWRASDDEISMAPSELFRTAELFPSSAARVLKDLLAKVGRPIPEAESCINESVQREADRLYSNVRWLNLAAAVTPLIGLLGTVWGMILAFYNTTQLTSGSNRVESLAEGIYVALVTTLAGLAVAIPAAILAHYFEGKITKNLGHVEHELHALLPRFEQYEGRTRFDVTSRGISTRPSQNNGSVSHGHPEPGQPAPPAIRTPKMKA
jgi:biopolymer transport protein ExbB